MDKIKIYRIAMKAYGMKFSLELAQFLGEELHQLSQEERCFLQGILFVAACDNAGFIYDDMAAELKFAAAKAPAEDCD